MDVDFIPLDSNGFEEGDGIVDELPAPPNGFPWVLNPFVESFFEPSFPLTEVNGDDVVLEPPNGLSPFWGTVENVLPLNEP